MSSKSTEMTLEQFVAGLPESSLVRREYATLLASQEKLYALEGAGVDNWEGYDFAMEEV